LIERPINQPSGITGFENFFGTVFEILPIGEPNRMNGDVNSNGGAGLLIFSRWQSGMKNARHGLSP
jgi:hypothetical protein